MERKTYHWCVVPKCNSTSLSTPNKLFIDVPRKADMRKKWFDLAGRKFDGMSVTSPIYFCEDHFDLPNDMKNYMQYHLMGFVSKIMLKPGCLPSKFHCQNDGKGSSSSTNTTCLDATKKKICNTEKENKTLPPNKHSEVEKEERPTDVPENEYFRSKYVQTNRKPQNIAESPHKTTASTSPTVVEENVGGSINHINMLCFSDTCRICKCSSNSFALTFNSENEVDRLFFNIFPELVDSKLNHVLKNLCGTCLKQLRCFENFKNHCLRTDQHFMQYWNQMGDGGCRQAEIELGIKQECGQYEHSQMYRKLRDDDIQNIDNFIYSEKYPTEDETLDIVKHEISISDNEQNIVVVKQEISLSDCEGKDIQKNLNTEVSSIQENIDAFGKQDLTRAGNVLEHVDTIVKKEVSISDCEWSGSEENVDFNVDEVDRCKEAINVETVEPSTSYICRKDFSVEGNPDEKPYECNICGKRFSRKNNLNTHKMIHEKAYECDVCGKKCSQEWYLVVHKRTHTGEKPYECAVCRKGFSVKGVLNEHMRIHTGEKPYECDVCGKRFSMYASRMRHKRIHTGVKPYECDVCGRSFSIKGNLKEHKQIHTGEKLYECNVCRQRFLRRGDMTKHKVIHTEENPHMCDICGKSFSWKKGLIRHKRTHTDSNLKEANLQKILSKDPN